MKLLKGFQSIVLLLVALSFLLVLYNYILKLWREGFGNLGGAPTPPASGSTPPWDRGDKTISCGSSQTCKADTERCEWTPDTAEKTGPGTYNCVPLHDGDHGGKGVSCGALTCRVGSRCAGGPGNYHCAPAESEHGGGHGGGGHGGGGHVGGHHLGGHHLGGHHLGGRGVNRSDKINCQKPEHGVTKSGRPHGWNEKCIVPPGVTPDERGFSTYKLCGGRLDEHQKENGYFSTDCRKRWKVTSKGEVSLASPSTHGYTHGQHKHGSYEKPRSLRKDGSHRYKQWIPDHLDKTHITQSDYEKIGKKFIADEARSRGIHAPPVLDSEAEVLGRLVWRVYMAEIEQKRANSPKSHEELIDRETSLLDKVSQIMRSQTDYTSSNKCASIIQCAKEVNSQYLSNNYTHGRTTNMYGHHHEEPIKRKVGYAFEGRPLHGSPAYSDANSAIAHCKEDRGCGGINYNTHTHRYELMPKDAHLVKRRGMVAYVKNQGHAAWKKHCHSEHGYHDDRRHHGRSYHGNEYDHQRQEDSPQHYGSSLSHYDGRGQAPWSPRNPNLMPKPYNSLMDLFR